MNIQDAIKILESHNKWRRGNNDIEMTAPSILGEAIDIVTDYYSTHVTQGEDIRKQALRKLLLMAEEDYMKGSLSKKIHTAINETYLLFSKSLTPKATYTIPVVDKKITVSDLERMKGELGEAWAAWDIYRETPQFDPETAHAGQFIAGYKAARQHQKSNSVVDYENEAIDLYPFYDLVLNGNVGKSAIRMFNTEQSVKRQAHIRARQMSSPSDQKTASDIWLEAQAATVQSSNASYIDFDKIEKIKNKFLSTYTPSDSNSKVKEEKK